MRPLHSRSRRTTLSDAHQFHREGVFSASDGSNLTDGERSQIIEEISEQLRAVADQHFPRTQNLEYAVLKSHLIIEHALTQFIRGTSSVLVEPESIRFTFAQKLEIAILHGLGNGCPITVPSIELLNRIRNQVAHRFSIDQQMLDDLIRLNAEDTDPSQLTDRQKIACIRRWCYFLCGQISGELAVFVEVTKQALLPPAAYANITLPDS